MGGGKGGGGTTVHQPEPIDPGSSMGEYLFGSQFTAYGGITDPRLQEKLIGAEARYRPQYSALELADINTMWEGYGSLEDDPNYLRMQVELAALEGPDEYAGMSATEKKAALGAKYDALALENSYSAEAAGRTPDSDGQVLGRILSGQFGNIFSEDEGKAAFIKAGMTEDRGAKAEQLRTQISETEAKGPVKGYRGLLQEASRDSAALQREMLDLQRGEDVAALQEYAPQVVQAYRDADPYSTELADLGSERAKGLIGAERSEAEQLLGQRGLEFAASTGELTPLEQRRATQSAREASTARGRGMDQSALYGEMQSRMAQEMNKQEREMAMGSQLLGQQAGLQQQRFGQEQAALGGAFGMQRQMAGDIGSTILGRPSSAIGLGQQGIGAATNLAAGQMGPQLFDPNVGMNMALAQRGQDVTFQGMQAQANAAQSAGQAGMLGGAMSGIGSVVGGMASGGVGLFCWVAREVYGADNPKWLQFRAWMLNDAPSWFRALYVGYGERFAKFISNKPLLKRTIRKWMDTKIK